MCGPDRGIRQSPALALVGPVVRPATGTDPRRRVGRRTRCARSGQHPARVPRPTTRATIQHTRSRTRPGHEPCPGAPSAPGAATGGRSRASVGPRPAALPATGSTRAPPRRAVPPVATRYADGEHVTSMLNWQVRIANVAREGSPGTTEPTQSSLPPETCVPPMPASRWSNATAIGQSPRSEPIVDRVRRLVGVGAGSATCWAVRRCRAGMRTWTTCSGVAASTRPGDSGARWEQACRPTARWADTLTRPGHPVRGLRRALGGRRRHTARGVAELPRGAPAR
jgi:hypothetical protein